MKIRIGISAGGQDLAPAAMSALGRAVSECGFDSVWLPEVLSRPGPDPLVGLAWVSGACPDLKIGTTMLLPGRNLVWLAKAVATLDVLSGGRFLLTFVPGISIGTERQAIGIPSAERGGLMDEALPVLRRLWAGEAVTHDGPSGVFNDVTVSPRPAQDPFDVWLGGNAPAALERCGRIGDGWIPAMCTPEEAAAGKQVIDQVAADHGRAISPEHFGVSIAYAPQGADLDAEPIAALARRARGRPLSQIIPSGLDGLRTMIESFLEVGFSKFVVRPLAPPAEWRAELEALAGGGGWPPDMSTTFEHRRAAAVAFLRHHGADTTPHLFGDLLSHLTGVEDLVRAWGGTDLLALAALGHATYGTDGFEPHILELSDRAVLAETIGPEAEDLVYFYDSCDRDDFYPQLEAPDTTLADLRFRDRFTGTECRPPVIRSRASSI